MDTQASVRRDVAGLAGLRQSHLTYYYPTRVDLLAAVARAAIDGQLAAVDAVLNRSAPRGVAEAIAKVIVGTRTQEF